ncbi:nitroreductase family protein [Desulforamulus aquiferis]|uniref:Nitroreductase family protein n=1 Tax=Desulforamulus aquiferis TaxID=1397668 RepID=A0AAW7ZHC2_9FIRM|nr:nitroreductase family protein [Desulforamulus aquiferis]MDO7789092.1 nitroreductase family protein [Desulforamulus aquiferis]RYD03052.1 hypothetical protein N752_21820 [Desulforamulus aquiferis]
MGTALAVAPKKEWYNSISQRNSRRNFKEQALDESAVEKLVGLCQDFKFPEARAELVLRSSSDIYKGAMGSYGKIKGAPAYMAFIANTSFPHHLERLGYLGEGLILEATNLGLSTCWVGGFFRPETVANALSIGPNERVMAVTPVGYTKKNYSLEERLMSGMAKSKKRLPIAELVSGLPQDEWPRWVKLAVEAARLAPSAVNRQPWRFHIGNQQIIVMLDSIVETYNIPKRLDCGIAMLHIELGALACGVRGDWQFLNEEGVAVFTAEK